MGPRRRAKKFVEKQAVALRYRPPADRSPRLTAKGRGQVAERILESEIPPELYRVVAEILAFVYSVNEKWKKEKAA